MVVSRFLHLACDWPACTVEINAQTGSLPQARKFAAAQGWSCVAGLDLCGQTGGNHAAAAASHLPAVISAGHGRCALSCGCGWEYPYAVDAALVGNRWRMHLVDVLSPPSDPKET